jgi:hypothetical protein
MDQDAYDDLLQRLTALVIKMDESLDELKAFNREQKAINQTMQGFMAQQIITNQRLETLLERAWRSSSNGRSDA